MFSTKRKNKMDENQPKPKLLEELTRDNYGRLYSQMRIETVLSQIQGISFQDYIVFKDDSECHYHFRIKGDMLEFMYLDPINHFQD